jgi:hypothetical protein
VFTPQSTQHQLTGWLMSSSHNISLMIAVPNMCGLVVLSNFTGEYLTRVRAREGPELDLVAPYTLAR